MRYWIIVLQALAFVAALPRHEAFASFRPGAIERVYLSHHHVSDFRWNTNPRSKPTWLLAKKKRKRRKPSEPRQESNSDSPSEEQDTAMDGAMTETESSPISVIDESDISTVTNFKPQSDQTSVEAMRGSGTSGGKVSAKELLRERDRNLEQAFEFDEVSDPLPKFDRVTDDTAEVTVGKKRARSEARKAAAVKAAEEESESASIDDLIADLPFVGKKPGEKTTPLKLLETGAWIGIGILVLWEIYLNSPFFDRAAPLSPIVY